jgi:hypothetical protein
VDVTGDFVDLPRFFDHSCRTIWTTLRRTVTSTISTTSIRIGKNRNISVKVFWGTNG